MPRMVTWVMVFAAAGAAFLVSGGDVAWGFVAWTVVLATAFVGLTHSQRRRVSGLLTVSATLSVVLGVRLLLAS